MGGRATTIACLKYIISAFETEAATDPLVFEWQEKAILVEKLTARAEGGRSSENHPAKVPFCKQQFPSGLT